MMPCEHGYYGLCPQCVREERDELRSRVAKLERERDQLALSLSATRAERDHAVRSAELWESEHRAGYEAMGVYKHLWLEGRAIMAVCGYFSRMRGPDLQVAYKQFGGGYTRRFLKSEDAVRAHRDDGYEITPFYAGSAPVPAVDTRLTDMEARKDAAYFERNQVVAALAKCFPSIVTQTEIPGWSSDWHGCVYIQLPTGQVSWHFHESQMYLLDGIPVKGAGWDGWDGHDTEEKYRRLNALPVPAAQMDNPDVMARATAYARDIVTWLHRDHYADNTRFEPFDDLLGLLSQIDNMVCGWKELSVAAICNAYESGVGHRGRPTANVNPYREGTPEHEAYAIGARGEAAQAETKVADDVGSDEWSAVVRELMAVASYRPSCQKYIVAIQEAQKEHETLKRFAGSLLSIISEVSNALGISEDEQLASNGAAELLIAIEELKLSTDVNGICERIEEYGGHRENEGGSYATFQKSEAHRHRADADAVLGEIRAMLAAKAKGE